MADEHKDTPTNSAGSDKGVDIPNPSPHPAIIPASPPRFISMQELMDTANLVQNMKLVHEIALDDDFSLEPPEPPPGSIEQQVADTVKKAFWDVLTERLAQSPPNYSSVLTLIEEIKQKLLECLLPQRQQRIRDKIEEVLDMQLIEQKVENEAFDISYYSQFVTTLMAQLCCPVRDEEIAKLKEITEIVPMFKEIFRLLDLMKLDMANYTLREMRPFLKEQSVNYERQKFDEFVAAQESSGCDGAEYTREWLERSMDSLEEQTAGKELFNTSLTNLSVTPANVLHGAYLQLLNWKDHIFPETCLMDQQKFLDIAYNLRKLALISSTLLVAFTHMGDRLTGHSALQDRLKVEILALLADVPENKFEERMLNIAEHVSLAVNKELEVLGFTQLSTDQLADYKSQLTAVVSRSHPVHSLLWKRMMTFIWQSLAHSGSQPLQLPAGLGAVSAGIAYYSSKYIKLSAHNKAVFGARYADIVATLMSVADLSPRLP